MTCTSSQNGEISWNSSFVLAKEDAKQKWSPLQFPYSVKGVFRLKLCQQDGTDCFFLQVIVRNNSTFYGSLFFRYSLMCGDLTKKNARGESLQVYDLLNFSGRSSKETLHFWAWSQHMAIPLDFYSNTITDRLSWRKFWLVWGTITGTCSQLRIGY